MPIDNHQYPTFSPLAASRGTRLRLSRAFLRCVLATGVVFGRNRRSPKSPQARCDEVDAQAAGHLEKHQAHEDHHVLHHLLLHGGLLVGRRRHNDLLLPR